jgi:hypothetical protein
MTREKRSASGTAKFVWDMSQPTDTGDEAAEPDRPSAAPAHSRGAFRRSLSKPGRRLVAVAAWR